MKSIQKEINNTKEISISIANYQIGLNFYSDSKHTTENYETSIIDC